MRQCEIYLHGIKCGILTEETSGFSFKYDKTYLTGDRSEPVSLTLPLRSEEYRSEYLFPAFANILSEGENRQAQAQLLKINPEDDFGIMMATCGSDTIGAITVKPIK